MRRDGQGLVDGSEIAWGECLVIREADSFELLVKKTTSHSLALRVNVWRLFHSAIITV